MPMETFEEQTARLAAEAAAAAPQEQEAAPAVDPAKSEDTAMTDEGTPDAPAPDIREEIRTQLAAHLDGIRNDVQAFLRDEVAPLRGALALVTNTQAAPAAALSPTAAVEFAPVPEDVQGRLAVIEARLTSIDAKIKHWV